MWAKSFGEDADWVDEHFEFQKDGTTITPKGIFLNGKGLTELPKGWIRVEGNCLLSNNQLTSLKGSPENVRGNFACSNNQLTSLIGAPKSVGGSFFCYDNQLTSLDELPEVICELIFVKNNPLTFEASTRARVKWKYKLIY